MFTAMVLAGAFVPWVWYVYHLGTAGFQEPVLAAPTSVNLFSTFSQFLFGFQNDNINTFFLSLWPVTVIFGLFTLQHNRRLLAETEYLVVTILASFGIAFFGSFLVAPIFVSRYLIFTVPSLYLLLASILDHYTPNFAQFGRVILAGVMIATLGVEIVNPTTPVKENYASAAAYLTTHTNAQDSIVLSAPFTIYPVQYYYRGSAPLSTLPLWNQYAHGAIPAFTQADLPNQVTTALGSSQNVYLLLSYDQGYEKNIKDYFESHFKRISQQTFSNDLTLYVYQLRYDTTKTAIDGK
jgi:hypothetical protein